MSIINVKKSKQSFHKDNVHNIAVPRMNRYKDANLSIKIKTFGTPNHIVCSVVNSSISGLLIHSAEKTLPFQVKTLTEIEVLTSDNEKIGEDIHFLGRVVRIEDSKGDGKKKCFGIQIIDIEEHDYNIWKEHVCHLKENAKDDLAA